MAAQEEAAVLEAVVQVGKEAAVPPVAAEETQVELQAARVAAAPALAEAPLAVARSLAPAEVLAVP